MPALGSTRPVRTMEGHDHEAGHVEGGHHRGDHCHHPEELVPTSVWADGTSSGQPDDLVLGEEPGEGPDPTDGKGCDPHRDPGDRHELSQTTHIPHILRIPLLPCLGEGALHCKDHCTGAEEEECLEEGVRHQVEEASREGPDPDTEEHVPEL